MDGILSGGITMNYTIITILGAIISCAFACFVMADLIEYRVNKKKARVATVIFTVFYIVLVMLIYVSFGSTKGGQLYMFYGTIPLLIFFSFISLYRDGRLFFSFFASHILLISVICITNLVNSYFPTKGQLVSSIARLLSFPILFVLIHRFIATPYKKIQNQIYVGWSFQALIAGLFYVLILYTYNYPVLLYERPSDIPIFLFQIGIVFLFLYQTVATLTALQEKQELEKQKTLFNRQMETIASRIEQTEIAEKQLAAERHDLRHRYNTILSLLADGDTETIKEYVNASSLHLDKTGHTAWCANAVISATVDIYASIAEYHGILLDVRLDVPQELPVSSEELSVVFANALENAINAVKSLPEDKRQIQLTCIHQPKLMLQIKNPVGAQVHFDKDSIPVASQKGHGIGTWSIEQYCRQNNAVSEYFVKDGWFVFRLGHMG